MYLTFCNLIISRFIYIPFNFHNWIDFPFGQKEKKQSKNKLIKNAIFLKKNDEIIQ